MSKRYIPIIIIFYLLFLIVQACDKLQPEAIDESELLDGSIEGLSYAENQQFLRGDIAFNDEIFTVGKGLGPTFVATSCGSCHAGDGKGTPFTTLIRFGQTDETGNLFLHLGGPQLQNRAIPGYTPEAIPPGATFSKFTPPANTGLGFIELVSDMDILAMADPFDTNNDGISGVPNYIDLPAYQVPFFFAVTKGGKYIGRFGKKASTYSLLQQTVNAYNQDMGITSTFNPHDVYSGMNVDPEVSDKTIADVVFYLRTLKTPIQRDAENSIIKQGQTIFSQISCNKCHVPELKTSSSSISPLSNKKFYPYTDLLLHDMGSALDDGYTEGSSKTYEWRTPALWGLGLSPKSQGGQYFLMHDGRAKSIEEAIQLHGGEAATSRTKYTQLPAQEKEAIIKFLKSL
ncbi:di-heme oxidoredictase family protein [Chryseobacterium indoltheticum]|uniref:Predicted thiol oxidoreductase n=1 Tax=Chryseobacterium indoltheticum TaxID=254 RepID=A0A381FNW2_9FLAO|nr:di-heme oxidoredictase family protein [Chryseobacterium indoltheticum]SUX48260.1 Predicted thiol oxidoreductase [Chryseobacterium indoltheticum]